MTYRREYVTERTGLYKKLLWDGLLIALVCLLLAGLSWQFHPRGPANLFGYRPGGEGTAAVGLMTVLSHPRPVLVLAVSRRSARRFHELREEHKTPASLTVENLSMSVPFETQIMEMQERLQGVSRVVLLGDESDTLLLNNYTKRLKALGIDHTRLLLRER